MKRQRDMIYRLVLSIFLSSLLLISGCTTAHSWENSWHNNAQTGWPWHRKPYHQPYQAQPVTQATNNTTYYYKNSNQPYAPVGKPNSKPPQLDPYEVITNAYIPGPYNSILVQGTMHVVIKGNQNYPCVKITGPRYALKYITITNLNGQLSITTVRNTFGAPRVLPVSVEIYTSNIQNLTLQGNGTYIVSDIGSQGLNLNVSGNGAFNLTGGNVVLYQLDVRGNTRLNLYWVNTNNCVVHASGGSKINLAGVATNLEVTLSGDAVLDAKYLRSQMAYVKTRDYSCAWIYASQALNGYADNYSDIYYYPDPQINGPFYVHDHGAIMRMAGLPY